MAAIGAAFQKVPMQGGVIVRYDGGEFVGWCAGFHAEEAQA
jgi:hypothetical protein